MTQKTFVRFECGSEDRESAVFGPFEYVQLTYGGLTVCRAGVVDDDFAAFISGWWQTGDLAEAELWSDVVIWGKKAMTTHQLILMCEMESSIKRFIEAPNYAHLETTLGSQRHRRCVRSGRDRRAPDD